MEHRKAGQRHGRAQRDAAEVGAERLADDQPDGAFLRADDPASGRWYSRDTAAVGAMLGLSRVAPYFIDAARADEAQPIGGPTVVAFRNNPLVYALTWFAMAGGLVVLTARALRRQGVWRRGLPSSLPCATLPAMQTRTKAGQGNGEPP